MKYQEVLKLLEEKGLTNENVSWANVDTNGGYRSIKKPINHIEKYGKGWNIDFYVRVNSCEVNVSYTLPNCKEAAAEWSLRKW